MHDLAHKSVRAGVTTIGSQGFQFLLKTLSTVVLARLLTPADFGIIGMVAVVINFAAMFKDAGLSLATVQRETITHEQISTLFWINLTISALLSLLILAAAPLVSWIYGKPELTPVTIALSFSLLLSGMALQHQALQRRHMRFGTLAMIQILSQSFSLIVTVAFAIKGYKYWSLVVGTLLQALSASAMTLFFCPWIPGRARFGTGVRDMLKFGGNVSGANMANYFSSNADNMLIGKFLGADSLGLYAKAYQLLMLPIAQIRGPLQQVALPVLSSLHNQPERYVRYFKRISEALAVTALPIAVYCIIEADFIIRTFLGSQWLSAVPIFRVLSISGIIRAVTCTWGLVPLSCGHAYRFFKWSIVNCICFIVAIGIGLSHGLIGIAIALVVTDYVLLFPCLFYCFRNTPVSVPMFLQTFCWPLFTTILSGSTALLFIHLDLITSTERHLLLATLYAFISLSLFLIRPSIRQSLSLFLSSLSTPK